MTVRGWPRGAGAAAELVDLVALWCGDVAAVTATPAEPPARELPGGEPVVWSMLTMSGATVLVAHEGAAAAGPLVRVSFAGARLEAGPAGLRWVGGAQIPLLPPPVRTSPPGGPSPGPVGLVATAAALTGAIGGGELARGPDARGPVPADLGDLLVVARVLEALRTSARSGRPERVA